MCEKCDEIDKTIERYRRIKGKEFWTKLSLTGPSN